MASGCKNMESGAIFAATLAHPRRPKCQAKKQAGIPMNAQKMAFICQFSASFAG
jgi:hypothetical protein